ncbi:MAG: GC-type dockerin domain-anchored protein, partial [Phycisphaerales bacterium]
PQLAPGTLYIDNNSNQGDTTDFSGAVDIVGNLSVTGSGQIGHFVGDAGLHLTITGDVMIGASSGVNLVGRGYGAGQGPGSNVNISSGQGGAGHGGRGGNGSSIKGGVCVGSVEMPVEFGSGSPRDCSVGAYGGGAIRLSVGGILNNDGAIVASGGTKGAGCASGGSAGGSIIIETSTYAGSGSVQANGAVSNRNDSGGGGGGRIALYYDNFTSTGSIFAAGGNNDGAFNSVRRGGAGTIWLQPAGDLATLVVDNDGIAGQRTEFSGERMFAANLIVADAGSISHPPEQSGCHLIFAGDVTVSSGGEINVEGRGFPAGQGPGSDFTNAGGRPGAGHGGRGGDGSTGEGYGSYGSADLPTDLGSGSPRDCNGGSSGGGAIRITSAGDMTIDGLIKADGELTTLCGAGGASGGSILLEAQRILGAGEISSDGSRSARSDAGGGGGGRISMLSNENLFTGAVHAYGGTANATNPSAVRRAGAGTVWIQTASSRATLIIDNNGNRHQTTEFAGPVSFDADLIVRAGGVLSHPYETSGTSLSFTGDVTVQNGGASSVTGRGYRAGQGPGTNTLSSGGQGGAGYGGAGGRGSAILGSAAYGSSTSPLELGSGAGVDCGNSGGSGGGALLLNVDGTLQVDGEISANGGTRGAACGSSGSSGGSLWINAGAVTGSGVITANGAPGNRSDAGGGGGGRIAIYSCAVSLPLANITAAGGTGYASGSNGTIYFGSGTISVINQPDNTSFQSTQTIELTVEAVTSQPASSLTYQWRRRQPFGEYVPLIEGQDGRFFGVTTDTLSIVGIECTDGGYYDCIISDSCGFFPTTGAFVAIRGLADYDESGSVDGDDIIAFFADWDIGDADADLTGDGGVDGDDVIFFFSRWDQSC